MRMVLCLPLVVALAGAAAAADEAAPPDDARAVRRDATVIAVEKASPAVVNIRTERMVIRKESPFFDPLFDQFFGGYSRQYKTRSIGSGVIIDSRGYVVTNAHVVSRASKIQVMLMDGSAFHAQVVNTKPEQDLALLQIEAHRKRRFPAVPLGTSRDIMVGETCLALGNPFGLQNSVSRGVISAKNRHARFRGKVIFKDLLQTDAAINPGNSGGPLVNLNGQLIGINTAIYSGTGMSHGIGLAIPVDRVRACLIELFDHRAGNKWIGADTRQEDKGPIVVVKVHPDGPGHRVGMRAGDRLVAVNGRALESRLDVGRTIFGARMGEVLKIDALRDGKKMRFEVAVLPIPEEHWTRVILRRTGLRLKEVAGAAAENAGLPFTGGFVIAEATENGPAHKAGLRAGLSLLEVDGVRADSLARIGAPLEEAKAGESVRVHVARVRRVRTFVEIRRATVEIKVR